MLKSTLKRMIFGKPGAQARTISRGLLKNLTFVVDASTKAQRLMGFDEREIAAVTRKLTDQARSALDIGANDGWYTLYFASRPNILKVYAFEPDAKLIKQAEDNLKLNDPAFAPKVALVNKFVGQRDDEYWCSLDALLPELPKPVVVKLDVDGGEMDVLRGGRKHFTQDGFLLVIETHTADLERDCKKFLEELGYRTRIINLGWYRPFLSDGRTIAHNRWLIATR